MPCRRSTPRLSRRHRQPACPRAILAAATIAALAASLPAQTQFGVTTQGRLIDSGASWAVAVGDVDGDGDRDLVFGNEGQSRLYLNDGQGRFTDVTTAQLPQSWLATRDVVLGDVDGDGDLDLVLGNNRTGYWYSYGQNTLYLNNGTGVFTDATATNLPANNINTNAVALGDVDGDGDLDLVVGNGYGSGGAQNRLYVNSGTGVFTDATATALPVQLDATNDLVLGDVDGDGDLDLVVANGFFGRGYWSPPAFGEQNRLLLNSGSGTFTDATATHLPVDNDFTRAVTLGDVDGDGDLDLAFGNTDTVFQSAQDRLLRNTGAGTFLDVTASHFPVTGDRTLALAFGDTDLDGDLDLVAGSELWGGQGDRLFQNQGGGLFVDATARLPFANHSTGDAALSDLDGDGDPDLVCAVFSSVQGSGDRIYTNLLHQLDAPLPFRPGQTYQLDAYLRYGPASQSDVALPAISLGAASLPLPPYGTLGIDPGTLVLLPVITIPQPAGVGSVAIAVPFVPGLVGLQVYSQALLVPLAGQARLSNVVADVMTIEPIDLIVNGGFEQPALGLGTWNVFQTIPGWTTSAGCGIEVWSTPGAALGGAQNVETDSHCPTTFFQDVMTIPGRSYVLSLGHSPRPGVIDNAVNVLWNAGTVFALQQNGTGLSASAWTVHRTLVSAVSTTTRLEIADASVPDSYGGLVDEVTLHEVEFLNTIWLVGEVVLVPQEVLTLRSYLLQAQAAQASNNLAAKAAALQAFVSHVQSLPATAVGAGDAALLVSIAGLL